MHIFNEKKYYKYEKLKTPRLKITNLSILKYYIYITHTSIIAKNQNILNTFVPSQ